MTTQPVCSEKLKKKITHPSRPVHLDPSSAEPPAAAGKRPSPAAQGKIALLKAATVATGHLHLVQSGVVLPLTVKSYRCFFFSRELQVAQLIIGQPQLFSRTWALSLLSNKTVVKEGTKTWWLIQLENLTETGGPLFISLMINFTASIFPFFPCHDVSNGFPTKMSRI